MSKILNFSDWNLLEGKVRYSKENVSIKDIKLISKLMQSFYNLFDIDDYEYSTPILLYFNSIIPTNTSAFFHKDTKYIAFYNLFTSEDDDCGEYINGFIGINLEQSKGKIADIESTVYHELIHAIQGFSTHKEDFHKEPYYHSIARDAVNYHDNAHYFLVNREIEAFFGNFYFKFSLLAADPENHKKIKALLAVGDIETIFLDLTDREWNERLIFMLYFGASEKHKEEIDYYKKEDLFSFVDLHKGILRSFEKNKYDTIKKKFLKTLVLILENSEEKDSGLILIGKSFYDRLVIAKKWKEFSKDKNIIVSKYSTIESNKFDLYAKELNAK